MSGVVVVGLFESVEKAASAGDALRALPLPEERITCISSFPLPDGAVCRDTRPIRFPRFTLLGWFLGLFAGLALALATYLLYPLITGGKAIISVPPTLIVAYEVAMLGALIGTAAAGFREMGLLRFRTKTVHDPRIQDGRILVCAVVATGDEERAAIDALSAAGGADVRAEEGTI